MAIITESDFENEKAISTLHKNYRKLANARLATTIEEIRNKNLEKNLEHVEVELKELTLNLEVASNAVYKNESKDNMRKIELAIKCMEECDLKLAAVQLEVDAVRSQLHRLRSEKAVLGKRAVSDNAYLQNVNQAGKNVERFSNRLHTLRLKEGSLRRWNKQLREMAKIVINERMLFNYWYGNIVDRLSRRKKLLIDMADEAILALDLGTDLCKRITNLKNKSAKDLHDHVNEMSTLILNINVNEQEYKFFENKGKPIEIRPLSERERKRRDAFKLAHGTNIERYQQLLEATQNKTGETNTIDVVDKFKSYECKHFSYYTYLNELNLHIENMIGASASLPKKEQVSRTLKKGEPQPADNSLAHWQERLNGTSVAGTAKEQELNDAQTKLNNYFNQIKQLFLCLKCNNDPRCDDIKDDDVTPQNYSVFLCMIEMQLKEVLSQVYYAERREMDGSPLAPVSVRDVDVERPQPFNYSMLSSLMYDCAECEASQNVADSKVHVPPIAAENLCGLVKTKINSPEMQYRMHNIDKCNIPRSRILYTKHMQNNWMKWSKFLSNKLLLFTVCILETQSWVIVLG